LVAALRHKPEGRQFIPGGVTAIFHSLDPSGRTTDLGSTEPLTEMDTGNISWGVQVACALG
jgi:hypothetical protein